MPEENNSQEQKEANNSKQIAIAIAIAAAVAFMFLGPVGTIILGTVVYGGYKVTESITERNKRAQSANKGKSITPAETQKEISVQGKVKANISALQAAKSEITSLQAANASLLAALKTNPIKLSPKIQLNLERVIVSHPIDQEISSTIEKKTPLTTSQLESIQKVIHSDTQGLETRGQSLQYAINQLNLDGAAVVSNPTNHIDMHDFASKLSSEITALQNGGKEVITSLASQGFSKLTDVQAQERLDLIKLVSDGSGAISTEQKTTISDITKQNISSLIDQDGASASARVNGMKNILEAKNPTQSTNTPSPSTTPTIAQNQNQGQGQGPSLL
jgi:hypothetical protein